MLRRFLVPVLLVAVAIGAAIQAQRTNEASDPGEVPTVGAPDFVVGTPMLSVRRSPEWLRQPLADSLLEGEVRSANITRFTPPDTCIVAHRDGLEILSIQADDLLVPASNQKILTAAAILELANPSETFTTEVVNRLDAPVEPPSDEDLAAAQEGEVVGSTLVGDLYLIGGGDPVLSTPDYIDRYLEPRAATDFTMLADAVAAALTERGITVVSGGIIADETRFTEERDYVDQSWDTGQVDDNGDPILVEIWKESFVSENQAGPLSALLLNDGYTSWPDDPILRVENVRAADPALAAAEMLRVLLAERGIEVQGASSNDVAPLPSESNTLGTVESPELGEIVARMLTHSDNTTAEMLLKEIGVRTGRPLGRVEAVEGMKIALADAGYAVEDIVIADGSGLSSVNRLRCSLIIEILDDAGPDSALVSGMAVVGESGTLRECLRTRANVDDVLGKTGRLNDVTALSGMTVADNGDVITFAMIANGPDVGSLGTCDQFEELHNEIQITLIEAVVGHPYGPALVELGPLSAVAG